MFLRRLLIAALLLPSLARADEVQDLATRQLAKLRAACTTPHAVAVQQLTELQSAGQAPDWKIYMGLDEEKWSEFVREPACKTTMLENTVEGMRFFIDTQPPTSKWINHARKSEASSLLLLAVSDDPAKKPSRLTQAAALLDDYIDGEKRENVPKDIARGMGYYFAAHAYLSAAKLATLPADIDTMLARALELSRAGMRNATDTSEMVEPYGISLGEIAKRLPKGSPQWRKTIEESIAAFAHTRETDPLSRYNTAIDYVLLDDMPSAKKELQALADSGHIDGQVCIGLMTDPDLQPLRDADMAWFRPLVMFHCQPTIQRMGGSRSAHPPFK